MSKPRAILKTITSENARKKATRVIISFSIAAGATFTPILLTQPDYYDEAVIKDKMVNEASEYFAKYKPSLSSAIDSEIEQPISIDNVEASFMEHITQHYEQDAKIVSRTRNKYKQQTHNKQSVLGAIVGLLAGINIASASDAVSKKIESKLKEKDSEMEM